MSATRARACSIGPSGSRRGAGPAVAGLLVLPVIADPPVPREPELALDQQLGLCLHPTIAEKVLYDERHAPRLLDRVTALLATTREPGDMGTLLVGLEPLLERLDRPAARAWYKANHQHIRDAKPCEPHAGCPACVAGRPCSRDVVYQLLTRRALDYGTTAAGAPVSLLSKQVKKDLYYGKSARKIDTWPAQGLSDMAAHMLWLVVQEARAKHQHTTVSKLLASAVERRLHLADPHLALEVARHWARTRMSTPSTVTRATACWRGSRRSPLPPPGLSSRWPERDTARPDG